MVVQQVRSKKMAEQSVLTEFFSAAKSSHFQPTKRRKIVTSHREGEGKAVDDIHVKQLSDNHTTTEVAKSSISARKKGERLSRKRSMQTRKSRRNAVIDTSVEIVGSKPSAVLDDHNVGKKQRKVPSKQTNIASMQNEASIATDTSSVDSSIPTTQDNTPETNEVKAPQRNGLKVNPWISDQAKIVLASRGRQALQKSLGLRESQRQESTSEAVMKAQPIVEKPIVKPVTKPTVSNKVKDVPRLQETLKKQPLKRIPVSKESSPAAIPAYQRFSHLLTAKKPSPSATVTRNLPLPYTYKMLAEFFRCVDVVLSLKQKRYETCTFEKLKESVQEMCRKTFEKKHLSQIKTIYPEAYLFHQQRGFQGKKKSDYQLTIEFNLSQFSTPYSKNQQFRFIESTDLITRQKYFNKELLKATMKHHREYLAKNHPTMSVDDNAIMRWHPSFSVDTVPEITLTALPEPPQVNTYSTAQDVLGKARQNMLPRVEKSLANVAKKNETKKVENLPTHSNETPTKPQKPALKGVSQSLIEKIRQKEEKKLQETLTADPVLVQKRVMLQRLPELCRILKTYFVSERKAAIPLEDANLKLSESSTSTLSPVQVEKHLKLLAELAPESVSIMHVRKCPYVKLKKNVNINSLVDKIKAKEIN